MQRFSGACVSSRGGGGGVDKAIFALLERWGQRGWAPDLPILLPLPVEQGLARAGQRSAPDRFEREQQEFFLRVRAAYLARAECDPARFRVVDASQPLAQVQTALDEVLADYFAAEALR